MANDWWSVPKELREKVLNALRLDHDEFADLRPEDEEYPGEGKQRAEAIAAAIELLGGVQ